MGDVFDQAATAPKGDIFDQAAQAPHRGFFGRMAQSVGIPTSVDELKEMAQPATIGGVPVALGGSGAAAVVNYGKNVYSKSKEFLQHPSLESAADAGTSLTPGGANQKNFAQDVVDKNYSGAAGTAVGTGLQMAAPEIAERTAPFTSKVMQTTGALAEPIGDVASKIPGVGKVVEAGRAAWNLPAKYSEARGKIADIWSGRTHGPDPGAPLPEAPPEELRQGAALFRGAKPGEDASAGLGQIPRGSIAAKFKDPGAPLPTKPSPELQQGSALLYGAKPIEEPAAGLGQIPVRKPGQAGSIAQSMAQQTAPPFQRGQLSKLLDEQLSKATNAAPPPNPKEPIYKRGAIAQAVKSAPSEDLTPVLQKSVDQVNAAKDIPEGHTPVQSAAMKSYKYDPAAREFHARMTSGDTTYVYGDVSPEDAQAFEAAESKGKALPQIKRNPLVAKIINGKRVAVKPGQ